MAEEHLVLCPCFAMVDCEAHVIHLTFLQLTPAFSETLLGLSISIRVLLWRSNANM